MIEKCGCCELNHKLRPPHEREYAQVCKECFLGKHRTKVKKQKIEKISDWSKNIDSENYEHKIAYGIIINKINELIDVLNSLEKKG